MQEPLVDRDVLLEKFPGKGGWTFARIPEVPQEKKNYFGWKKVNGFIDSYELKEYNLMPMGKGQLFLPVRAEIRKAIKKQEGDWVRLVLYAAEAPVTVSLQDFYLCLEDDPEALKNFKQLDEPEQKKYVDWVYSAKTESAKVDRIAEVLDRLAKKLKMK